MIIKVRCEIKDDYPRISEINNAAFNQPNEAILVEKLRKTPDFIPDLSLVAETEGEVVGHILFYPIKIDSGKIKHDSLALAPMSVHPDYQNRGIGSRLVNEGLRKAKSLGCGSVIVLGHSGYYPRFGFEKASKWSINAPFDVPDDVFLALELKKNGLKNIKGTVEYPNEFNEE